MAAVRTHRHRNRNLLFLLCFFLCFPLSSPAETQSLLKLKQSFTNADQSLASWLPNVSPCSGTWAGIICFNNIVTGLHLSDLNLSGTIDVDSLAEIRSLRTLSFVNNSFSGPIPTFNKLGAIKSLLLSYNHFSGPIPQTFFATLSSLKKVWLSGNKFSGEIPVSLTEPDLLKELHLEGNQFTGRIPNLKQDFRSFNVSNNKLEGPIPETLSKFAAASFSGNEGLCGKPLDKPCDEDDGDSSSSSYYSLPTGSGGGGGGGYASSWAAKVIVILILAAIVAVIVLFLKTGPRGDDDFSVASRDSGSSMEELVQVHVPRSGGGGGSRNGGGGGRSFSASRSMSKSMSSTSSGPAGRKESSSSSSTSSHGKKGGGSRGGAVGDLVMVNEEKGVVFGMQDLMKAAAEVLGNGGLGSAYKATMANGLSVVVKRMREMNKIGKEVFDAEMRQFGRIKHPNILTPLAYHYRKEEKLFVTEYMRKGSLLYVLHGNKF